ncbi:hypothetical protein AB870_25430 (plasmid) [Pandoraea faecigallinarum]|uniref:Uncharacterized protein n=1 Tax=Pandoraea faecigallinarum TaxID=656179 RepID=A0A0H3X437_9BURK|nr:hypothetical protein [Pandoraea faecigallinarum]AKM33516.1 hypothetical protein AB870_25430 [Pandoraea faecigallinarum]
MKNWLIALLIVGAAASAHASDFGCKVLLCLANPASNGGPQGVAECVAPIDQLYHDLDKGRPFPTCDLADGNDGGSYARQVYDPYDPCPPPLQPAARGAYVVQGRRNVGNGGNAGSGGSGGIGWDGSGGYTLSGQPQMSESQSGQSGGGTGPRACVGKPVGTYTVGNYDDSVTVNVFVQVLWQPAQNPRAIDVFINNVRQQRVRW